MKLDENFELINIAEKLAYLYEKKKYEISATVNVQDWFYVWLLGSENSGSIKLVISQTSCED